MKKLFWILLLIALPSCQTIERQPPAPLTPFEFVCEQITNIDPVYTCLDIEEPIVVVSYMVEDHYINRYAFLRGVFYPGEPYVFVRAGMEPEVEKTTTIHEITHYVLYQQGVEDKCLSEEYARFVAGQDPTEWRERYGCLKGNEDV